MEPNFQALSALSTAGAIVAGLLWNSLDRLIEPIEKDTTPRESLSSLEERNTRIVLPYIAEDVDWKSADIELALEVVKEHYNQNLCKIERARIFADEFDKSKLSLGRCLVLSLITLAIVSAIVILASLKMTQLWLAVFPLLLLAGASSMATCAYLNMRNVRALYRAITKEVSESLRRVSLTSFKSRTRQSAKESERHV